MTKFLSTKDKLIGRSVKYTTPISLDPAPYVGAVVYADDGVYFSDGAEWKRFVSEEEIQDFITERDELFLQPFSNDTRPPAAQNFRRYIYNTDEDLPQFSDGVEWKSVVDEARAAEIAGENFENQFVEPDTEVTVGATGDFPSIKEAIEFLLKRIPVTARDDAQAKITVLSGHTVEDQVFLFGINAGWIELESEDDWVPVNGSAFTQRSGVSGNVAPIFGVYNGAVAPSFNIKFDFISQPTAPLFSGGIDIRASQWLVKPTGMFGVRNAVWGTEMGSGCTGRLWSGEFVDCNVGMRMNNASFLVSGTSFRSNVQNALAFSASTNSQISVSGDVRVVAGVDGNPDFQILGGTILRRGDSQLGAGNITPNTLTSDGIWFAN